MGRNHPTAFSKRPLRARITVRFFPFPSSPFTCIYPPYNDHEKSENADFAPRNTALWQSLSTAPKVFEHFYRSTLTPPFLLHIALSMQNKSTISTLLPFQGVNGFTNDNPTQGAASLALGYALHWAFSPPLEK